jgi:H+/gluconate symporter-like permease
VAGLVGSSQVFQTDVNSATVGKTIASAIFTPCVPASAINTAITVTTTANGTATAVDVNAWGYQL